ITLLLDCNTVSLSFTAPHFSNAHVGSVHSKSVVHGDLTGSNVLIYGNFRACLADFGLSTVILEFVGTSYFTSSIRGNVRWVAAELCEVSEDDEHSLTGTECDIYLFGSIVTLSR
ncbi:uncharacterized protein F5147DRAFT_694440, partial [Suillus discolor]